MDQGSSAARAEEIAAPDGEQATRSRGPFTATEQDLHTGHSGATPRRHPVRARLRPWGTDQTAALRRRQETECERALEDDQGRVGGCLESLLNRGALTVPRWGFCRAQRYGLMEGNRLSLSAAGCFDHQHRVGQRVAGKQDADALLGKQGCGAHPDQVIGAFLDRPGCPGELRCSWPGVDTTDPFDIAAGEGRGLRRAGFDGTHGASGRGRSLLRVLRCRTDCRVITPAKSSPWSAAKLTLASLRH